MGNRNAQGMNSDISKCYGRDCPLRNECVRYITPANRDKEFQSYIASPGVFDEKGAYSCSMFWEVPQIGLTIEKK